MTVTTEALDDLAELVALSEEGKRQIGDSSGLIVLSISSGSDGCYLWLNDGYDTVEEVEEEAFDVSRGYRDDRMEPSAILVLDGASAAYRKISYRRKPKVVKQVRALKGVLEQIGPAYGATIFNGVKVNVRPTVEELNRRREKRLRELKRRFPV